MECKDIRELLSAYMDDVIDLNEKRAVEQHLVDCAHCRQELADLRKTVDVIKSLGEVAPPETFRPRLREKLMVVAQEEEVSKYGLKQRISDIKRLTKSRWMAFAAVLIVGLGIGLLTDNIFKPMGSSSEERSVAKVGFNDKQYGMQEAADNYKIMTGNSSTGVAGVEESNQSGGDLKDSVEENAALGFKAAQESRAEYDSLPGNDQPMAALDYGAKVEARGDSAETGDLAKAPMNSAEGQVSSAEAPVNSAEAPVSSDDSKAPEVRSFAASSTKEKVMEGPNGQVSNASEPLLGDRVAMADKEQKSDAKNTEVASRTEDTKAKEAAEADKVADDISAGKDGEETGDHLQKEALAKADEAAKASEQRAGQAANQSGSSNANEHQIIKNGWLTLEVKDFNEAGKQVNLVASKYGGYVEKSQEHAQGVKKGSFVVRVPVNRFAEALAEYEKVGKVISKQLAGEDVSVEYRDANARLGNMRRQETRLLTLVDKAESLADVLALENELARIRQEIETLEARIRYLSNVTEMATINLEVHEVKEKNTPGAEGVFKRTWNAFKDSCNQLITFLEQAVVLVGKVLPYLAMVALILGGYNYYRKRKQ